MKVYKKINLTRFMLLLYIIFFISWLTFAFKSSNVDSNIQYHYIVLLIGYFIVGNIFFMIGSIKSIDIFEPLTLATVIYIMFFSIAPMIDILTGNTYFFGYNVVEGTSKATIIFIIGYISFIIGYIKIKPTVRNTEQENYIRIRKKVIYINLMIWIVSALCGVIYLMSFGRSILYIFTFGFGNSTQSNILVSSSLAFLSMFAYSMVVPWIYIMINCKSIILNTIITYITVSIYFILGFRFIILIMIISPIVYYYIKNKKRPSIITITLVITILVVMIGFIGYIRGDVRSGNEINWSTFDLEDIWYGMESNFEIYKGFYRMVEVVPENYSYTMGKQMSYAITMFIPRVIWPAKPDTPLRDLLRSVLGDYGVLAGTAWPNIAEFYSEFGIFGVVIFMYLFGVLLGKIKQLYIINSENTDRLIAYSILLPTCFQLIIRGYTPTNFWLVVFFIVPMLLNYKLGKKQDKIQLRKGNYGKG